MNTYEVQKECNQPDCEFQWVGQTFREPTEGEVVRTLCPGCQEKLEARVEIFSRNLADRRKGGTPKDVELSPPRKVGDGFMTPQHYLDVIEGRHESD